MPIGDPIRPPGDQPSMTPALRDSRGQSTHKYYKVAEVASILRVKKEFVYELVESGQLKALRLSPRRIRIPATALEEFEASRQGKAPQASKPPHTGRPLITRGFKR